MGTYTILGATGNIGHIVVENLLKRGHKVKAIGRNQQKLKSLQAMGAETFSGDITDGSLLLKVSKGSDALFALSPPKQNAPDFGAYQDKITRIIVESVQKNKIPYVLDISSIGAELFENMGPIKGLHRQEESLNAIADLHVLHLRAGFFMENLLLAIPLIKRFGFLGTPLRADLAIQMVATKDIGERAAEFLDGLNFKGHTFFDFVGPQSLTLEEATQIIGEKIGQRGLSYQQFPYDKAEEMLVKAGMSPSFAKSLIEMDRSFNENKIKPTQEITKEHKGKTTFEKFLDESHLLASV